MRLYADAADARVLQIRQGHNQRLEWGAIDVTLVKRYVDTVIARLGGQISYIAGAIAIVPTIDCRLAGTLNSNAQAALASATRIDHKLSRLADNATLKARPEGVHLIRITARQTL